MTTSFDRAWEAVDDVQGWMTEGQARALFAAASDCPPDATIVEIGSFHGRSTIVLAMGAPHDAHVVAIDPHAGNDRGPQQIEGYQTEANEDHERFLHNLAEAGVSGRVRHLRAFSDDALAEIEGQIDVLYVDGAHRYGPARRDIERYGARVRDGGVMLIHDSFSSIGVTTAICRVLLGSGRWRYDGRTRSLATYRAAGDVDRVRNGAHQLAQLPWFLKNVALKVLITLGLGTAMRRLGRDAPEWPY